VHRALDLDTWPVFPRVRFSTARTFYETLEKQSARLPTLDCELNTEFTGCYTTQTLIKKANRFSENGLLAAETSSALAWSIARHDYPNGEFVESWRDMLFSHFHDILPGSGVHDTRTYCHGMYQRIMAATSMAETRALRHLASLIDTSGAGPAGPVATIPSVLASGLGAGVGFSAADGRMSAAEQSAGQGPRPFLLFHTNPGQRNAVVEAVVWDNAPHGVGAPLRQRPLAVKGPDGTTVPAQVVHSGGYWGHEFVTLAFPAKIDGIGYAVYTVVEEQAKAVEPRVWHLGRKHHCPYAFNERSPEGLENECVRIEIDTTTGGIRSLVDKRSGRTLMAATGAAPALEYGVERPHGMTSWAIDHTGPIEPPEVTGIRRKLDGPYKAALEVSLRIHESDFALTYELRAGEPLVYLHLEGTWFERGTPQTGIPVLRFAFPFTLEDARARYEIPFGAIDRDIHNGDEVPALQWAQVSGTAAGAAAGCLLLNDSKHGHSLDGNVLRLTLIRSSYDPDPLPEIGRHEIHVALMPFGGDISAAEATRIARDFNLPIRVMGTDVHPGDLPTHAQWVSLSPANVILSGLKKSEDSDALVFRLYETAGEKARAELKFNADCLGEVVDVQEVDLMERPVLKSTAKARAKAVSVAIPPRGIATVCVRLKRKT
jgi:alpha-mannosidase